MEVPWILECITQATRVRQPILVAIDGPGGAGKSTFADGLSELLATRRAPAQVVHGDDFFRPEDERPTGNPYQRPIGSDFDWVRLREEVLLPLSRGACARYQRYDWYLDALTDCRYVDPRGVVIVEGVYSMRRELAALYHFRIWVECPRATRLARALARDGAGARERWERDWMPCEDRYIAEHRPHELAEAVIDGALVELLHPAQLPAKALRGMA